MDYWNAITAQIQNVCNSTIENSSEEVDLLRRAISLYAEAFAIIVDPVDLLEPLAGTARKALVSHNFNTLNLAFDAAVRGYYVQSLALLRIVYENWLAFWYLAKHPKDADRWTNPRKDRRPFKAETLKNYIDHPSKEAKSTLENLYDKTSKFIHTDPSAVLSRVERVDQRFAIRVGVHYDQDNFAACTFAICLWARYTLDLIGNS